jgi:hypothetical protein
MAVISTDTFRPLNRYVGVRLQQGVPIVDADWNELDDVRKFEVRAFLKWFVGNGIPEGTDGFRIDGTGANNTFTIRAGITGTADGLNNVGRCVVDGLDVLIDADLVYTAQPLHTSQPGAAALAAQLGVPVIPALTTQTVAPVNPVTVFLDVWERLLTPTQEPTLIHPGLGTESCARLRREWVVRTRSGTNLPASGDPDFVAGHSYYALATITRRLNDASIQARDVTDQRERRLLTLPASLTDDLFGTPLSEYRRGRGRPAVSLREAINALLRGELPSTPDRAISPAPGQDISRRGFMLDGANGILAFWTSNRSAATDQIFVARLDLADVAAGFVNPPVQVTTGTGHSGVSAALTPAGDFFVVYQTGAGAAADVTFKRGTLATLAAAPEAPVANTAGTQEGSPFVVVSDQIAMVFYHTGAAVNRWSFRRRNLANNTWVDNPAQAFGGTTTTVDLHAARDSSGNVWAAYRVADELRVVRITPSTGAVLAEQSLGDVATVNQDPFLLPFANGDVWLFWRGSGGIRARRFVNATGVWEATLPVTGTFVDDLQPTAVADADGAILLISNHALPSVTDLRFFRRDPVSGGWSAPRALTASPDADAAPHAFVGPDGATWVFWTRAQAGNVDLYFKRVVTAL